jgi:hypothetical protein
MNNIPENFVRLPGRFSDYYISRDGRMMHIEGIPVHMHQVPDGYITVTIRQRGGRTTTALLHRLLAMAFVPNLTGLPIENLDVNHKNGIKIDNRLDNLEWVTRRNNSIHAYRKGMRNDNVWLELHPDPLCRETWVKTYGDPLWFYSLSETARFLGVNPATLHEYLNGPKYGVKPYHGWFISYCDNRSLTDHDSGDCEDPYNQMSMSGNENGLQSINSPLQQ